MQMYDFRALTQIPVTDFKVARRRIVILILVESGLNVNNNNSNNNNNNNILFRSMSHSSNSMLCTIINLL
jgi:hypothetical protein